MLTAVDDATDMRNKKAKGREASSPVEAGNTGTMGPPPKPVDLSRASRNLDLPNILLI